MLISLQRLVSLQSPICGINVQEACFPISSHNSKPLPSSRPFPYLKTLIEHATFLHNTLIIICMLQHLDKQTSLQQPIPHLISLEIFDQEIEMNMIPTLSSIFIGY